MHKTARATTADRVNDIEPGSLMLFLTRNSFAYSESEKAWTIPAGSSRPIAAPEWRVPFSSHTPLTSCLQSQEHNAGSKSAGICQYLMLLGGVQKFRSADLAEKTSSIRQPAASPPRGGSTAQFYRRSMAGVQSRAGAKTRIQAPWVTGERISAGAVAVACTGSCSTVAC